MTPRLSKIVWTDWPALFCAIAIPIIWLIHVAFPLLRPGAKLLWLALAFSLVAGAVLVWRVVRIRRLFARGHLTSARVSHVSIFKDRGRLEFEYALGGKSYASWMPIHRNKGVLDIRVGQEVDVLVDLNSPNSAIVRQLFV